LRARNIRSSSGIPSTCGLPVDLCAHHGAVTKAENRVNRMTIAHLEGVIEEQEAEIAER
jgi:hypothetical protein